jgi:hypothetical protein
MATSLKSVNSYDRCPVCDGNHKCATGEDGVILCGRESGNVEGFVCLGPCKGDPTWTIYRQEGDPVLAERQEEWRRDQEWEQVRRRTFKPANGNNYSNTAPTKPAIDWPERATAFRQALTPELRKELADSLGLPETVADSVGTGWCVEESCWTFPELDGKGEVVGITRRYRDGQKKAMAGGGRGLCIPSDFAQRDGPVLLPEGPSDTMALTALGLKAVGRPSNTGGVEYLAELLHGLPSATDVTVLGEHDQKDNGQWPGKEGAERTASALSQKLTRPVGIAFPPPGVKDVRAWVLARQMDRGCADEWSLAGEELMAHVEANIQMKNEVIQPKAERSKPTPCITTLSQVQPQQVDWFWTSWIPLRAVTLLDGDPGLGKSTITLDLAARASRGARMPPHAGDVVSEPCHVLLLGAEDNLAYTIRPRLDAAGADVSRIHALEAIKMGDHERPPVLPGDLDLVQTMIIAQGIRLVIVDPLMAFLGTETDSHKDQDIRQVMHQLKLIAERTGAAILVVRHLNKNVGGPAIYRGGGSIGIIGAVRSAMVVGKHPKNDKQRVLAINKCNLAAPPRSLVYAHEPVGNVARIGWVGECDLTAEDILAHSKPAKQGASDRCAVAIGDYLGNGKKLVVEMEEYLKAQGFTASAIREGRKIAGVKAEKPGFGKDAAWMASIPKAKEDQGEDPFGNVAP